MKGIREPWSPSPCPGGWWSLILTWQRHRKKPAWTLRSLLSGKIPQESCSRQWKRETHFQKKATEIWGSFAMVASPSVFWLSASLEVSGRQSSLHFAIQPFLIFQLLLWLLLSLPLRFFFPFSVFKYWSFLISYHGLSSSILYSLPVSGTTWGVLSKLYQ